jgi:hypothetical protein
MFSNVPSSFHREKNNRPAAVPGNRMAACSADNQYLKLKNSVQYFSQWIFTLAGAANYLYTCIVLAAA